MGLTRLGEKNQPGLMLITCSKRLACCCQDSNPGPLELGCKQRRLCYSIFGYNSERRHLDYETSDCISSYVMGIVFYILLCLFIDILVLL